MAKELNAVVDKVVNRSTSSSRNNGKIPKKIHKAEREKLKRDHLNELFLELGNALESSRQNSGKASVLDEATRFLRDLIAQVECLKRENAVLLSESHYVSIEKNELRDENSVLEADIEKLQTELQDKAQIKPNWDAAPVQLQHKNVGLQLSEDCLALPVIDPTLQQPAVVGPVFVIPLNERHGYPELEPTNTPSKPSSNVSRPHAQKGPHRKSQVQEDKKFEEMGSGTGSFLKVVAKNFDVLAGPLVTLVYPLYASVRAIETKSRVDDQQWLTYWVLYSMITLFELTFAKVIEWLPFWSYAKLIVTCWLVLPYFSGAAYVYEHFVRPFYVNRQTINIWYIPRKKDIFSKPDDILTAAEKYIEENGPEAFETLVSRVDKGVASRRSNYIFDDDYEYRY
ncbi:hypothetical protein NE237_020211 [Protea cynaroides]|uniref:BHLH domain-containing protein n=1 Tax=Protea cynaroides TaxID=273540 RepID=A0A9Q0K236_9MAGN|nr:hypothetical protein NE237_020211 [Protea cynaroides]